MTNNEQIMYYDVKVKTSFPQSITSDTSILTIKLLSKNVHSFLFYCENFLGIGLDSIEEIRVYNVTSTVGRTRVNFKLNSMIDGYHLRSIKNIYTKTHKTKIKNRII